MTEKLKRRPSKFAWIKGISYISVFLWISLWVNLNSGYWDLVEPHNLSSMIAFARAAAPFLVLVISVIYAGRYWSFKLPSTAPSRMLLVYGAVAAFSTLFSSSPWAAIYWAIVYLGTVLAAWMFVTRYDSLKSSRVLLQLSWLASLIVAAIITYTAWNSIFNVGTGYNAIDSALEMQSRSSGVARWAAVPGLVCIVRVFYSRKIIPIAIYLGLGFTAFYIVYKMQSRGAVFGVLGSLLFLIVYSSRVRKKAMPVLVIGFAVLIFQQSEEGLTKAFVSYLARGQSQAEFVTLTGRTRAYKHGWAEIQSHPILGQGHWADRILIGEHVHNSFLQAFMSAGLVGGIPYIISWITGWTLFFRLQKNVKALDPTDRMYLLECGTVMMFFSIRAIPETTTASFAVDELVMVAVYVYMESLLLKRIGMKRRRVSRPENAPSLPGSGVTRLPQLQAPGA